MKRTDDQLNRIYDRTSGRCHLCGKKLSFKNYGQYGEKAAWHVEHSRPRAKGGTDHGNNLYAACIDCNLEKSALSTRTARAWYGRRRAPLSQERRIEAKNSAALAWGILGAAAGALVGPWGVVAGALIGAKIGHETDPDEC
jgi:5-methylcytosine-specific restriction endonuclease McrA